MTHDDALLRALDTLDELVDPSPLFADRLYRLATVEVDRRPRSSGVPREAPRSLPVRIDRRGDGRWMQIAAVAVLLLSMIGGIARVSTGGDPTSTIQAPEITQRAVMIGGTAAQGSEYPGPMPAPGSYIFRPNVLADANTYQGPALVFGDQAFVLTYPKFGSPVATLQAIDLATERVMWRREIAGLGTFAITWAGVVTTLPVHDKGTQVAGDLGQPPNSPPYRVALLDLESGDAIWQSAHQYGGSADPTAPVVLVEEDRIYLGDPLGSIVALDLETGEEIWTYSVDQTPAPGLDPQICPPSAPSPGNCWGRNMMWAEMAVKGPTLYYADPVSATITALSTEDGSERWRIFTPDRIPRQASVLWLVAFAHGAAVMLFDPEAEGSELNYVGFWAADDGSERWSIKTVGDQSAADESALFLNRTPADKTCCLIERIEVATGKASWQGYFDRSHVHAYLSTGTLVLATIEPRNDPQPEYPQFEGLIGVDPMTGRETRQIQVPGSSCFPILPVADNGDIACLELSSVTLGIFQPIPAPATPASPVASQPEPTALPFERGDTLVTTADGVALRAEPDPDAEIWQVFPAGGQLSFIGEAVIGSDGAVWYRVRSNETALTGYIRADQLAPEE